VGRYEPFGPGAIRSSGARDCATRLAIRACYVPDMCGRARLSSDVTEIKLVFSIPPQRPTPNIAPSWNVAPTHPHPVVRHDATAGERSLDLMRWGLVPFWANGHQGRLFEHQRQGRGDRGQAGLPRGVPEAALPGAGR
jgi:hypothetical protein